MSLITTGLGCSNVDPTSNDLISLGYNLMVGGGGGHSTVVTKLPGRASHPLKKNCDLHFFPNWQAFPGVREASDSRKTRTVLSRLDFSVESTVLPPTDSFWVLPHCGHVAAGGLGALGSLHHHRWGFLPLGS